MDDEEVKYQRYRCYMHSAPGMWTYYEGTVDVWSPDESEVFIRAVKELARTSFPDRPSLSSWRIDLIEKL